MDKKNPLGELMQESMSKVREMVDTNTIVGQPINTPDGVTLIPISKVSIGFGGGGSAFGNKKDPAAEPNLGGCIGSGVKIDPVAFLTVKDGIVRVLPVAVPAVSTADRLVELVPDVVDKVTNFVASRTKPQEPETDVILEESPEIVVSPKKEK